MREPHSDDAASIAARHGVAYLHPSINHDEPGLPIVIDLSPQQVLVAAAALAGGIHFLTFMTQACRSEGRSRNSC